MRPSRRHLLIGAAARAAAPARAAEDYPAQPVRLVVGFPPGSSADLAARLVSGAVSPGLGRPVVVENRPGAGSSIAAEAVSRAAPDGYTLLLGTVANTINASLQRDLRFDFGRDFAPVSGAGSAPNILVVHPSLNLRTVPALVDLARARPGAIFFASSGIGTSPHLSGELFNEMAGVRLVHAPYPGSGQAVTDLVAGRVPTMFAPISTVLPHVEAGRLIALATTGRERTEAMPALPTVAEAAGLPGYETALWYGLFAPARTPRPVVDRLASAMAEALAGRELRAQLVQQGMDPLPLGPEPFARFVLAETEKWARVVRVSGAAAN